CYQLYDVDSAWSGVMNFPNFYAENLHRIGNTGGFATNQYSFSMSDGEIAFTHYAPRGIPSAMVVGDSTGRMHFRNMAFTNYPDVVSFCTTRVHAEFDNCLCVPNNAPSDLNTRLAYNGSVGGLIVTLRQEAQGNGPI